LSDAAQTRFIDAGVLRVAYVEHGDPTGRPVVLLHGFPYDVHAYEIVAPLLAERGLRAIVPYLRGYGPTRFLDDATPRSGQQAALGADLLALLDALHIDRAIVAGYDWGGRAACIVSALWPQRVRGLVSVNGYNLQDIARAGQPAAPDKEYRLWYQYYFHGERGRAGLAAHRRDLCRLLWRLWSPGWAFSEADFERTAPAFDNPDFVDVVIHSYRHRFALAAGDPALEAVERSLAAQPAIVVPTITLDGDADGVSSGEPPRAGRFTGRHEHRRIGGGVGHDLPQEAPEAFAQAVCDVDGWMLQAG
jgi:pimeloyl-ACP methyl ester carboxylesterase